MQIEFDLVMFINLRGARNADDFFSFFARRAPLSTRVSAGRNFWLAKSLIQGIKKNAENQLS